MKPRASLLALLLAVAGLAFAGCGGDSGTEEKQTVKLETFASPDGNIGCFADPDLVRCDIALPDWMVLPNPDCQLDWGNGLSVADGRGEVVCAGDTTMNDGPVLPHGKVNTVGPFECESSEAGDGMRCENTSTGHGFELSTATFDTF